jgi:CcmD family protein
MQFLGSLFAAYSVVWIGIFLYLLRLTRRTRQVEDEVEALRQQAGAAGNR